MADIFDATEEEVILTRAAIQHQFESSSVADFLENQVKVISKLNARVRALENILHEEII